jgi:hypothetical protein
MFNQGNNFCPADKIQHDIPISQLSCCYPILNCLPDTLPNLDSTTKLLHCKNHPEKKIKFVCEEHKAYLCTYCVLEHTGAGHLVKSFVVNLNATKERANDLKVKAQGVLKIFKRYKEKLDKRINYLDEHHEKQEAKLKYEYAKVLKLASQKQQRLLNALYEEKKAVGFSLRSAVASNRNCLVKVNKFMDQLRLCIGSMKSAEEFSSLAETAITTLKEVQNNSTKRVCPSHSLKVILIEDKSEVRLRHSHNKNTDQINRACSNARDNKKYGKKQMRKKEVAHKLEREIKRAYRHETLSPIRDNNAVTPSSLETTAATTKVAHTVRNVFFVPKYETPIESEVYNLINIQ